VAVAMNIDPWGLMNVPAQVFDAIVETLQEQAKERERESKKADMKNRLRNAMGR
jgi:hypothetical protein